jgi:hypothetical protein
MRKIEKHVNAVNSTAGLRSVPNPKKVAKELQEMGADGDDILAHINPNEATLLDMLADGRLDGGGINPLTGLKSFGMADAEGPSGKDSNPGGVAGGPVGPGNQSAPSSGQQNEGSDTTGYQVGNNPEMGGGRARATGLASVDALGPTGRNVNASSSIMAGRQPSWNDTWNDFVGQEAPGGFPGSRAANLGVTIAGGLIGGPWGAAAANVAHNAALGGKSLADTVPGIAGGFVAGGLGSMAAQAVADAVRGKESYEATMSPADRDAKDKASIENARNGTPSQSEPGTSDGAGAGTAYVLAPPEGAVTSPAPVAASAKAPKDIWDEAGFLKRNPEVAKAVENKVWTSGRSFNTAYKAASGANYDSAKALGLISPYTNDMLATRPGQAMPYRGL